MPPVPPKVFKVRSNPTLSAKIFIINKLWGILQPTRAPLSALVFIFRMSDMPFCRVKQRSNKVETQLIQNQLFDQGVGNSSD